MNFSPHPIMKDWSQAKVFFDNGYGVSVVMRPDLDTKFFMNECLCELAVLRGTQNGYELFHNFHNWFEKNPELDLYLYFLNFDDFGHYDVFSYITLDQVDFIADVVKNVKP